MSQVSAQNTAIAGRLRVGIAGLAGLSLLMLGALGKPAHASWQSYRAVGVVEARVTAYCPGPCCCGSHADGVTSIGRDARLPGVAVDPRLIPYGWVLWVPGAGYQLADDTGGAMRQSARRGVIHIDLRMRNHAEALRWGVRTLTLTLYEPEDQPLSSRSASGAPLAMALTTGPECTSEVSESGRSESGRSESGRSESGRSGSGRSGSGAISRSHVGWRRLEAIRERSWLEVA